MLNLPDDMAGQYMKAVFKYAIYGEETDSDNAFINAMLVPVKEKLDEDLAKYEAQVERMNKCRNQKDIYKKSDRSLQEVTSDTVTDTVTDTVKKNKRSTFHDFPQRKIDYAEFKKVNDNV
jgi:hypothetical protein